MSKNYDNWERLVDATVKREQLRYIALYCESFSSTSSDFSIASSLPDVPALEASTYPSKSLSVRSSKSISSIILPTPRLDATIHSSSHVKAFLFNELKTATRNFRPDSFLGEGRFSYVFKGWIDRHTLAPVKPGSGLVIVVKKLKSDVLQGHKEWLTGVKYLGQLCHPNLVKLIGYCIEGEYRLLVNEFMPQGSLQNHLFTSGTGTQPLSWDTRIKVAVGAARGLSFLHEAEQQVIYRYFKASNVLLDAEVGAKLSDFGNAYAAPTVNAYATPVDNGYAAPEYVAIGKLTTKSDVYSFGVVLLQLLSGREAVDKSKVSVEQNLVEWAKPYIGDRRKLFRVMDIKLEGQYPHKAASIAATTALQCLSHDPKLRPRMAEVLTTLEKLQSPKMQ